MAKIYTKNTWTDELLAGAERYDIKDNAGSAIESNVQINLTTPVAVAGSEVNAARMNNIETGIDALDTLSAPGAVMRASGANVQSLTSNKTLTDADYSLQVLTPTAARDVILPAVAATNHPFYIINASGSYALTVKNAGGSTIGTVAVSSSGSFASDATAWHSFGGGGVAPDITLALTHAASSKTPPVDADELPLLDSATSFSLKKLTWANIKAALNSVYMAYVAPSTSGNVLTSNGSAWISAAPASGGGGAEIKSRAQLAYVDASTISISAGTLSIGTTIYTRSSAFNVTFANLDTGAEAAGTNYYVYAVPGTSPQFNAVISASAASPTGYADYRLIGWFHNNGSAAILKYSVASASVAADVDYPEKGPKPGMVRYPGANWMIDIYIASDSGGTGKAIHAGNAAASAYNATPWVNNTYFSQYKACMNAGKRLCTNEEWSMAAFGSPAGANNNTNCWTATANTGSHATGTLANCVSTLGAYDMTGNVWERVATWSDVTDVYTDQNGWGWTTEASTWTAEAEGGEAYTAFGANAGPDAHQGPRALFRGGGWYDSVDAGGWAVLGYYSPRNVGTSVGFRCCA